MLAPALPNAGVVVIIKAITVERLDVALREIPLVRWLEEMCLICRRRKGRQQLPARSQGRHTCLDQLSVLLWRIVLEGAARKDDVDRSDTQAVAGAKRGFREVPLQIDVVLLPPLHVD